MGKANDTAENRVVFPGDVIKGLKSVKGVTVLGPGVKRHDDNPNTVRITRAGILRFKSPNIYWVNHNQKRYIPKRGELVVGIITKKAGDTLRIDIGSGEQATLSMLAFEGATKKQKPDVQVGDVIYAKVLNAHREMEPELVCVDSYFKAGKMGPLSNDGFIVTISLGLVHRLLDPENSILQALGKVFPYETAVGMNGRVWVNGRNIKEVLTVVRCLESAELCDDKTVLEWCRQCK